MNKIQTWFYIIGAVVIAILANSISAIWASKENKFTTIWFLLLIIISPLVFITFGLVTHRVGLSVSSATIDSLLTVGTILVGLFLFNEWNNISTYQYVGMFLAIGGIVLMQFHK
ncbi:hypothetical protein A2647_01920 [Candidatus Nomurabacteria bacterium RIFCSPHIGHO2_01_FULL_40_24b]|uniref:EamA domain-containing protein n=1 Tax=Candidatus Nomurabacteria bacterium RIFCSPHIGHO2_01_FULL_40_24b TaxID=1801739 RepID=A0A1F6V904_9BACT|nr:MAG: hypothetical protein A2647_01920 [Candidatus Nomurabacteria bacterium RIFCSPHIGHO2_01_FULL_40_24b]